MVRSLADRTFQLRYAQQEKGQLEAHLGKILDQHNRLTNELSSAHRKNQENALSKNPTVQENESLSNELLFSDNRAEDIEKRERELKAAIDLDEHEAAATIVRLHEKVQHLETELAGLAQQHAADKAISRGRTNDVAKQAPLKGFLKGILF